jgi:sugar lactone lactonase YvrE
MTQALVSIPYLSGLAFAEGLRYRQGELWFSDFHLREVRAAHGDGSWRTVARLPEDRPSGLGWLPDGQLLVVAMSSRRLMRGTPEGLVPYADLASVASADANDLLVDPFGRAYVSHIGGHLSAERLEDGRFRLLSAPTPARLVLVRPDGSVSAASEVPLLFPNGMVLWNGGRVLLVAETIARRISAFDIEADGSLTKHRIFAEVGGYPDGMAVDREGGVWFADTERKGCYRILEGGKETHVIHTGDMCFGCALGGQEGRDLFLAIGVQKPPTTLVTERPGRIARARVDVPAASWA